MDTDPGRSPQDDHGFSLCLSVFSVVKTAVLFQGQVNALAYNRSESPPLVHPWLAFGCSLAVIPSLSRDLGLVPVVRRASACRSNSQP